MKPSLRHGLPFRWWRSVDLRMTVLGALSLIAAAMFYAWLTVAYCTEMCP